MPNRFLFTLAIIVLLALAASACSSPNPQPPGLTPIPTLPPGATPSLVPAINAPAPDAALGAQVYQQNCSACHGASGQGGSAPALRNDPLIQNNRAQVLQTISNGHSGAITSALLQSNGGPLSNAQINNVIAYLGTLQNVPLLPTATKAP